MGVLAILGYATIAAVAGGTAYYFAPREWKDAIQDTATNIYSYITDPENDHYQGDPTEQDRLANLIDGQGSS